MSWQSIINWKVYISEWIWLAVTKINKNLEFNNLTEDHLRNTNNALLLSGMIIDKHKRDQPSYLLNGNTSSTATQTDPAFNHVYKPELF